jgi:hypothetical protein
LRQNSVVRFGREFFFKSLVDPGPIDGVADVFGLKRRMAAIDTAENLVRAPSCDAELPGLAGLLCAVRMVLLSPGVWSAVLKFGPAPFRYDNPALFSVPLAFVTALLVSALDRSESAVGVRAAFEAQHVRAQTGLIG